MARRGGERTSARDSKLDDMDMDVLVSSPRITRGYHFHFICTSAVRFPPLANILAIRTYESFWRKKTFFPLINFYEVFFPVKFNQPIRLQSLSSIAPCQMCRFQPIRTEYSLTALKLKGVHVISPHDI